MPLSFLSLSLDNKSKTSNFIFFLASPSDYGRRVARFEDHAETTAAPRKRDLEGGFDRLDTDGAVLMQTAKLRGDYPARSRRRTN